MEHQLTRRPHFRSATHQPGALGQGCWCHQTLCVCMKRETMLPILSTSQNHCRDQVGVGSANVFSYWRKFIAMRGGSCLDQAHGLQSLEPHVAVYLHSPCKTTVFFFLVHPRPASRNPLLFQYMAFGVRASLELC